MFGSWSTTTFIELDEIDITKFILRENIHKPLKLFSFYAEKNMTIQNQHFLKLKK